MRVIELSEAVGAENRAFATLLRKIGSGQMRAPVDGKLTTKDILGHVAAYLEAERLALAAGTGRAREEPIYFDDYQKWHEEQYERRRSWTPGRIVSDLEEHSARYLSLVK